MKGNKTTREVILTDGSLATETAYLTLFNPLGGDVAARLSTSKTFDVRFTSLPPNGKEESTIAGGNASVKLEWMFGEAVTRFQLYDNSEEYGELVRNVEHSDLTDGIILIRPGSIVSLTILPDRNSADVGGPAAMRITPQSGSTGRLLIEVTTSNDDADLFKGPIPSTYLEVTSQESGNYILLE